MKIVKKIMKMFFFWIALMFLSVMFPILWLCGCKANIKFRFGEKMENAFVMFMAHIIDFCEGMYITKYVYDENGKGHWRLLI